MKTLRNIHPGEVLLEEFLRPLHISASRLANDTRLSYASVLQIIKGKKAVTADAALRLSRCFGTTPKFWLGLQADFDIEEEKSLKEKERSGIMLHTNNTA